MNKPNRRFRPARPPTRREEPRPYIESRNRARRPPKPSQECGLLALAMRLLVAAIKGPLTGPLIVRGAMYAALYAAHAMHVIDHCTEWLDCVRELSGLPAG